MLKTWTCETFCESQINWLFTLPLSFNVIRAPCKRWSFANKPLFLACELGEFQIYQTEAPFQPCRGKPFPGLMLQCHNVPKALLLCCWTAYQITQSTPLAESRVVHCCHHPWLVLGTETQGKWGGCDEGVGSKNEQKLWNCYWWLQYLSFNLQSLTHFSLSREPQTLSPQTRHRCVSF